MQSAVPGHSFFTNPTARYDSSEIYKFELHLSLFSCM